MIFLKPLELTDEILTKVTRWYNDPQVRYLMMPNFREEPLHAMSPEQSLKSLMTSAESFRFEILEDEELCGIISLSFRPDVVLKEHNQTLWVSLIIAPEKRRQGIGLKALKLLEEEAGRRYFDRLELGTLSNNEGGQKLFSKAGYCHFNTNEHFTWYEGEWFDDLRFEKYLPKNNGMYLADVLYALYHLIERLDEEKGLRVWQVLQRYRFENDLEPFLRWFRTDGDDLKEGLRAELKALYLGLIMLSVELIRHFKEEPLDLRSLGVPKALIAALETRNLQRLVNDIISISGAIDETDPLI